MRFSLSPSRPLTHFRMLHGSQPPGGEVRLATRIATANAEGARPRHVQRVEGRHEGIGQDRLGDVGAIEAVDAVDPEHPALLLSTARAARAACKEVMLLERVLRTQRACIRLAAPLAPRAATRTIIKM